MGPVFTIGVTTYDRIELLTETLNSILGQTFSNFEVIVSNDNPDRVLSAESFGIHDPRIRFVNNPINLGELNNMNSMLGLCRGRYFTWIADDDLYAPNYLENVYLSLIKFNYPSCVFTSYKLIYGDTLIDVKENSISESRLFNGTEFLNLYLSGKLKAIGTMGIFEIEYLKQLGGLENVSKDKTALYSEYMILIKTGLLEKIVYIDAPLIFYRMHESSWGGTNINTDVYIRAGENLILKSVEIFRLPKFRCDFHSNFYSIVKLVMGSYIAVLRRAGKLSLHGVVLYFFYARKYLNTLNGSNLYWTAFRSLVKAEIRVIFGMVLHNLKEILPERIVNFVRGKPKIWALGDLI